MERGQALVETAIVLPLLVAVGFGGISLARLGLCRVELELAARAAAASRVTDPLSTAHDALRAGGLIDPRRVQVQVSDAYPLRTVTLEMVVPLALWPGTAADEIIVRAQTAVGRAGLSNR